MLGLNLSGFLNALCSRSGRMSSRWNRRLWNRSFGR